MRRASFCRVWRPDRARIISCSVSGAAKGVEEGGAGEVALLVEGVAGGGGRWVRSCTGAEGE